MSGALDRVMREDVDSVKGSAALFVWRNNQGKAERVPENEYGKFFKGDCYVIYNCQQKKTSTKLSTHIHFLIGSDSGELDERMDVAVQATQLDNYLGGVAVQFRELMGQESPEFTAIFNGKRAPNLRYAKGGYDTRLNKVNLTNKTQLYEIKGVRNAQATEVECKQASLNSDDCYVLDGGKNLFVLWGKSSNRHEKSKAYNLACSIRDNEQAGKGRIHIIDEVNLNKSEHTKEIRKLFDVVSTSQLRFENLKSIQGPSDEEAEKLQAKSAKLYKISDAEGSVEIKELGSPMQSMLDTNDCFILYTGLNVYVWKGRRANPNEKMEAIRTAKEFIRHLKGAAKLGIVVMSEFAETAAFRSCFRSWKDDSEANTQSDVDFSKPYGSGGVAKSVHTVIDFRTLHQKPKKITVDDPYSRDDGQSQDLHIFRVDLDAPTKLVACNRNGFVFNSGDSYVLTYKYVDGKEKYIIYYWLGNESGVMERGTAAKVAVHIDENEFNGQAVQERVLEGKEPPHFMRIFNGYILVKQDRLENNAEHMFHVRAKKENDARVVEVEVDASNLNSNDCFILNSGRGVFLWYGKGSTGDEQRVAREAAAQMYPKRGASGAYTLASEGKERADFWTAIGGEKTYATELIKTLQEDHTEHEARLYHCYNIKGSLEVEEVYDFDQDDLMSDDVMFLDTYYRLYIWVGKGANKDERIKTVDFVQDFIREDPTPRTDLDTNITVICEGYELDAFKAFFGVWEDVRVEKMSPEDQKRLAKHYNSTTLGGDYDDDHPENLYGLCQLQGVCADELPDDVNVEKRELYLHDDDFRATFGMDKEAFKALPAWQRDNMRRAHKLF